jgi:S-adenosylmethionine synthetase
MIKKAFESTTSFSKLLSADLIVAGKNVYVTENNEQLICDTIKDIGYNNPANGFDYKTCNLWNGANSNSKDVLICVAIDMLNIKKKSVAEQLWFW